MCVCASVSLGLWVCPWVCVGVSMCVRVRMRKYVLVCVRPCLSLCVSVCLGVFGVCVCVRLDVGEGVEQFPVILILRKQIR